MGRMIAGGSVGVLVTGRIIGFVERREMWDITWVKSA
jgi:hypothetical protein